MSEDKQERMPDTFYHDKHENEPAGIDAEDLRELAQMFGTVRGELNKVDQARAGLSSGAPVSKIDTHDVQKLIRQNNQPQAQPKPAKAQPVPVKTPVKSIKQPEVNTSVTTNINNEQIVNLEKRISSLEKQFSRVYKPVSIKGTYQIKSNDFEAQSNNFEDLFDFIKKCIKLDKDTITLTRKS